MQSPFSPDINTVPYRDRASAGRWLSKELQSYAGNQSVVVLGIPRGGVMVGAEIAQALKAPFDVFLVRKVQIGDDTKRTIGAIASAGVCVLNQDVLQTTSTEAEEIAEAVSTVREQVLEAERRYREGRPTLNVRGRIVVLADDGAASGRSLRAAVAALRPQAPATIIVATPVASAEAAAHLAKEADQLVCPYVPDPFFSIGLAFERFPRLTDEEVIARLAELDNEMYSAAHHNASGTSSDGGPYVDGAREE